MSPEQAPIPSLLPVSSCPRLAKAHARIQGTGSGGSAEKGAQRSIFCFAPSLGLVPRLLCAPAGSAPSSPAQREEWLLNASCGHPQGGRWHARQAAFV